MAAKLPADLSEHESGIAHKHISAISDAMYELDCFLFVRPTEIESTRLIKKGFATKSMDVHDKSSNWGPMAGCVPTNMAFCKKESGSATFNQKTKEPHNQASEIHLKLPDDVYQELKNQYFTVNAPLKAQYEARCHIDGSVKFRDKVSGPAPDSVEYVGWIPPREYEFLEATDKGGANSSVRNLARFLAIKESGWAIYWFNSNLETPAVHKLNVWGYRNVPITGDYDLWMVAPSIKWWKLHSHFLNIEDSHGKSSATLFITWLLDFLNKKCEVVNPVFNHGAEAQNYGFAQSLDRQLAMFTPSGAARMIDKNELPAILIEADASGYLIVNNKRYGQDDPHLSGRSIEEAQRKLPQEDYQKVLDDVLNIRSFHQTWARLSAEFVGILDRLSEEDFGETRDFVLKHGARELILYAKSNLQDAMRANMEGGGGDSLAALETWMTTNLTDLETLSSEIPAPPMPNGGREVQFMLRPSPRDKDVDYSEYPRKNEGVNLYHRPGTTPQ